MPSLIWRLSAAVGAPFSSSSFLGTRWSTRQLAGRSRAAKKVVGVHSFRLRQDHQKGHHLKVVDAGKLALHGMGAAGSEEAGHGALFVLADNRGHGGGEQALRGAHVLALLGRLVETGAGAGIGQVAPQAEALEPVEDLLGLGVGQKHRAVVAHMHQVVRRRADSRLRRCAWRLRPRRAGRR